MAIAGWGAACSSDAQVGTIGAAGSGNAGEAQAGAEASSGGAAGDVVQGGASANSAGAGAPSLGGASAGEAGTAAVAGSDAGANAVLGGAEAGGAEAGGAEAGGAGACTTAIEQLPLGTFTLQVDNSVQRCDNMTLVCSPEAERSGSGEIALTLSEWPGTRDGNTIYINGVITTTLDLNGSGLHEESYQGMLVQTDGNGWAGGFDLSSGAKSVTLQGDNCFNFNGMGFTPGHTLITVDLSDGTVAIDRFCEDDYMTFSNVVKTTGNGVMLCN